MTTLTPAIHADIIPNANIGDYFRIEFQPIAKIIDKAFHAGTVLYKVLIGEKEEVWRSPYQIVETEIKRPQSKEEPETLDERQTELAQTCASSIYHGILNLKDCVATINDECGNTITKVWWDDGKRLGGRYRNIPPGWRHSYMVPHEHNHITAQRAIENGVFTFKTYLTQYQQGDYWVYCRLNRQQQKWIEMAANQEQLIAA